MSNLQICTKWADLPEALRGNDALLRAFAVLSETMTHESTLRATDPVELMAQFENGLSCIAVENTTIVGHMTVRILTKDDMLPWVEHGSSYVASHVRGKNLYGTMFKTMKESGLDQLNMIGKSMYVSARRAGEKFGLIPILRKWLPKEVMQAVCSHCSTTRMRADNFRVCKRAWGEKQCDADLGPDSDACVFRTNLITAARHGFLGVPLPEDY